MKIIQSKYFPIFIINLFGVMFVRKSALMERIKLYFPEYVGKKSFTQADLSYIIGNDIINEETIHTEQMKWLGYIPYYLLYVLFYVILFIKNRSHEKAYKSNPFEREAKLNRENYDYCEIRDKYGWLRYF